jgi:NAD(P)-dependent dehydrogenase (short-subunit alcohol dehydrogenase family)
VKVLINKVAIVTGAGSGIGHATAMLFAGEGADLVVTARRQTAQDRLVADIERAGGRAVAIAGGVKEEALARRVVEAGEAPFSTGHQAER